MNDDTVVVFPDGFADALDVCAATFGMLRSVDNTKRAGVCRVLAECVRTGTEVSAELTGDAAWVLAETASLAERTGQNPAVRSTALNWARLLASGPLVAPSWVTRVHGTGEPAHPPEL